MIQFKILVRNTSSSKDINKNCHQGNHDRVNMNEFKHIYPLYSSHDLIGNRRPYFVTKRIIPLRVLKSYLKKKPTLQSVENNSILV